MECYVFIDDSNLWIAGQKAQGKYLKDADVDTRFRVDLGKFLKLVTKGRNLSKAFLYGSVPPPNDTVWKAAREKNFDVQTFQRSGSGREKEVDVAMATSVTRTLYTMESRVNVIFITVTGDRDLKTPIELTLNEGVPVELWSWEDSMSREFRQLANTRANLFTANILDTVKIESFGYTATWSTHDKKDIDPAHAIVYRDVPKGKRSRNMVRDHMHRLMRLFYITTCSKENTQDLIVEFPKTKSEVVIKRLCKLGEFEFSLCSYPEYKSQLRQHPYELQITNRFEALGKIEADEESLLDVVESSMSLDFEDISSDGESSDGETVVESTDGSDTYDNWATEVRRIVGKRTSNKKRKETQCSRGDHCVMAAECPYLHTPQERSIFARFPKINFRYFKTRECNRLDEHTTEEQKKRCTFAHDSQDSWCLACRMYGHLTDNCRVTL